MPTGIDEITGAGDVLSGVAGFDSPEHPEVMVNTDTAIKIINRRHIFPPQVVF